MGLFGDSLLPAAVKKPLISNGSKERRQEFERYAELYSSFLLKVRYTPSNYNEIYSQHEDDPMTIEYPPNLPRGRKRLELMEIHGIASPEFLLRSYNQHYVVKGTKVERYLL